MKLKYQKLFTWNSQMTISLKKKKKKKKKKIQ